MADTTDAKVEQVQRWSAEVQHGTLGSATRHYADPHGSWVHHDDYATLQAEVARLRCEVAILENNLAAQESCTAKVSEAFDERNDTCAVLTIRAEAAEAEAARLREDATRYRWLRDDPPVTLCVRQRHDEKRDLFYQYIDGSQLDAAIDAAMGSANGQG